MKTVTQCIVIFINLVVSLQPNAKESTPIQVTDFAGNVISLNSPATRIVALAPHIVENVFSAGAGDSLVGVVTYSDYPSAAENLPIVGSYEQANQERILELNPDLIIAWESGNSYSKLQRLKELGFTVYIDQPNVLRDVAKSIRDIGLLTGNHEISNTVADEYLQKVNQFELENKDKTKISTFYQVWNQPLQTINGTHIISAAIEICGGVNIYADEFAVAPIINIESILERDPDVIIASGMSDSRPDWLDDWLQWSSLSAVKNANLFFVDPDHIQRHTTRILLGIESICAQLDLARQRVSNR